MNDIKNNKNIDGIKIAMAFRQLENSEIFHESYDIEEEGVESILTQYGIFYRWTDDEIEILKEHLLEMAAREEIREAVRWAEREADPLINIIPDRPLPSPRLLYLQHKVWKESMKDNSKHNQESTDKLNFNGIKMEVV